MARPSKLTEAQWAEIGRRLAKGESVSALAREYGVSKATISGRFSERLETIKGVAKQVAEAEIAFASLPVSEQCSVRTLADELKGISKHLAAAARYGAMTAHRLSQMAHAETDKIDPAAPIAESVGAIKTAAVLIGVSNEAAKTGLNLLAANKDAVAKINEPAQQQGPDLSQLSDAELLKLAGDDDH